MRRFPLLEWLEDILARWLDHRGWGVVLRVFGWGLLAACAPGWGLRAVGVA